MQRIRIITYLTSLISLFFIIGLNSVFANSARIVSVADGMAVKVDISSYEHNRIKIEGGRINYYTVKKGALIIEYEKIKGEIFVSLPKINRYKNEDGDLIPISLFVTSDSGSTYQLLLQPKAESAKQIFLVEQSAKDEGMKIYNNYRDQILSFYKSLYSGQSLQGYTVSYRKKRIKKDKLKIIKIATYQPKTGKGLYGEIFEIKNKSKNLKILKPQDFFKEGVRAIKIDSYLLGKGESTRMYVISIRG